ncbi:MAG: cytochrome P450 [Candidatus Promineifilaceae bacterium]
MTLEQVPTLQEKEANTRPESLPPGPGGLSKIAGSFRMLGDNVLDQYVDMWHKYGDIVYNKLGPLHTYTLFDPEDIHHVLVRNQKNYRKGIAYEGFRMLVGNGLVTSEGQFWRRQRRLMQPSFTPTAVTQYIQMMSEVTEQLLNRWNQYADSGQPVHMDAEMMRLTTSIIGRALFNIDLSEQLTEVGYAFQDAFSFVPNRTMNPFNLPLSVPLPSHRRFQKSLAIIENFVAERTAEKRREGLDDSLLSQLLKAQDEETGHQMTDEQLRDEVVTLFFAGFETTARSLTWLWYRLSRHENVAAKLEEEVDRVLNGRFPTVEDLYELSYTNMIVGEVLRLYPPVPIMPRQPIEDDEIGGYPIPAGSLVFLVSYVAHRYPSIWDDPNKFIPERFTPELSKERPKSAYVPFANGQRICIGNNFALLEMVIACAMMAGRFRLQPTTTEEIPAIFSGTTKPGKPVHLYIHKR